MGLTRLAINRPLAILMLIIGLVLMGIVSYTMLPVDRLPKISFPFVSASVSYPGASPSDVELLIAEPIEAAVSGVAGVSSISSTSSDGRGTVSIQLAEGADPNQAAVDVERALARIRNRLPADAGDPVVNKADPNSMPILSIALSGSRPLDQLYDYANNYIAPPLQSVLGVANVSVNGGLVREVRVNVDYTKLQAYGLTLSQLNSALAAQNISTPAGSVAEGPKNINIRAMGLFQSLDDLSNLIIGTSTNGVSSTGAPGTTTGAGTVAASTSTPGPIFLHDVATVNQTFKNQTNILRLNGVESVGLQITKQSDANSLQVVNDVKATIASLQKTMPPDIKVIVTNDNSRFTKAALDSLQNDLGLAILLTGLVLLLFLHAWRNTLIVILAIPTSLISTFLVMFAMGFSLNTISMMALALSIGILVDDSIVVLENIHRHLKLGEAPRVAALNGRSEIGLAAMAITFVDVVVYVPVAFMQGNIGQLFRQYGLTVATATLFSLFVSFTLTPMLASRWMKAHDDEKAPGEGIRARIGRAWQRFADGFETNFERLADTYGRIIDWALSHRPVIIAIGALVLAISLSFMPLNLVGSEYAPQEDDSLFNVNVQMPPGTSLQGTDAAMKQLEAGMSKIPEISRMYTSVGGGGFGGASGRGGSISVEVVDKGQRSRSVFDIINDVRRVAAGIPEMNIQASVQSPLMGGGGGGATVRLYGDNLTTLMDVASLVEQTMRTIPGVVDVRNAGAIGEPEMRAVMDRKRMAEAGISATQVATALRTAITGNVATQFRSADDTQMDVTVINKDASKALSTDIAQVPMTNVNGNPVLLGQVASIVRADGPSQINRTDRQRTISVNAIVAGRPIGDVARDLNAAMATVPMPDGYSYVLAGQVQQLNIAFAALFSALSLSIVLIYMLMVALFESWLYPLSIICSLPVSLVGAFTGLLITRNTFNIFSMIGMIMLMGLVAKNAILLVDYTNTLRARGLPRNEALVQAGRTRLRPIAMTTSTIIFAMLPLAMKFEAGAESRSPMAVVVIGGVISSTLLTLVLVPVVYTYLDGLQARLFKKAAAAVPAKTELKAYPTFSGGGNGDSEK